MAFSRLKGPVFPGACPLFSIIQVLCEKAGLNILATVPEPQKLVKTVVNGYFGESNFVFRS